ncbi:MAG TPA: wax ester/triacylglycerol synthase family O-acyltransferase [Solirubrobacteraceae bacterium]|nr:wax ester/triacylglycerol synthase family O-acyltransferase [Solirubrobacteraceae bacterium]
MAPKHMDRLTSVDTSFLAHERAGSHMHIGSIMLFEGPSPAYEDVVGHIDSRLHLVPRYRQKLRVPRLELGRPFWVDDPRFNITYHVRHTALPPPGSLEQLRNLAGRIFSQRLDRSKPLWELWLVEGLEDGRFALINKVHHSLVDGVSGVDLTTVLFDLEPVPREVSPEPWIPQVEPSSAAIVARAVTDVAAIPLDLAGQAWRAAQNPGGTLRRLREVAEGVGEVAWSAVNRAPTSPLNVGIGTHRQVRWVNTELADLKAIKDELGGTVNDVFLTIVSGALGRWLRARGVPTAGLELRGAVPVSIRAEDERGQLGNRITIMLGPLPVYCEDPVRRLQLVTAEMRGLKESKQALGAEAISSVEEFTPPTIFAQASRLHFSTRMYNLLVTNVPGPQFPLYLLGHEIEQLVPVAFLAPDNALAIAIMSYNGRVAIGLIGDFEALADIDELVLDVEESIAELLAAAGGRSEEASPSPSGAQPSGANGAGTPA